MKRINLIIGLLVNSFISFSQTVTVDTNYATRAVSAVWMSDGNSLLIAVVKYHKTDRQAPFSSKVFKYDLSSKQLTPLFENGSNLAPSPDGKTIAFLKRDDNKRTDIYFFNTVNKKETVFKTDTSRKNSLEWSPDGKNLLYNISHGGTGQHVTIDICVLNITTKQIKQITQSGKDKSYDPNWCPDSKRSFTILKKEMAMTRYGLPISMEVFIPTLPMTRQRITISLHGLMGRLFFIHKAPKLLC
jgi:Tol biopolymer transport system component